MGASGYSFCPKSQKRRDRHGSERIQLFPKKVRAAGQVWETCNTAAAKKVQSGGA